MSQPGWYPDPSGQRGQLRFWDGRAWSQQTRPAAGAPGGPGGMPPTSPLGPGQSAQRRRGSRALVPVLLGIAAVVIIVAVIIGTGALRPGPRDITDNPPSYSISGFDDGSPSAEPTPTEPSPSQQDSPTPTETEQSETPPPPGRPCPRNEREERGQYPADGRVHGGNLSFPEVGGEWRRSTSRVASVMSFGYDVDGETMSVTGSWFVQMTVGAVAGADGFTDQKATADAIVSCIATSGFMSGATGRTDIHSKPITISGKQGWTIRSEVRIGERPDGIEGSVFDVVVIDSGVPDGFGFFVAESSIGHADELAVRDKTLAALTIG